MNPQVQTHVENPLLAKVKLPGRTFQLPSAGLFYKNGELSSNVENGEVHVYPMTALDEIHLKNPDMLFSGKAISIVFRHCVPDVKKPEELLAKDVDAIMIFLRVVTYGPYYEIDAKHGCKDSKEHTYVVDVEKMISDLQYLSDMRAESIFTLVLPNGQIVKLQPLRYKHALQILQMSENKEVLTPDDQEKMLITNMLNVIESVDGITDKSQITEWIRALSPQYMQAIAEAVGNSQDWGAGTLHRTKCKDCGEMIELDVPINPINFFYA